jgi:hypothetical protein
VCHTRRRFKNGSLNGLTAVPEIHAARHCRSAAAPLLCTAAAVASESALPYRWMRLSCLRQVTIEASDDFLVLATDGVWGEPWLGFGAHSWRRPPAPAASGMHSCIGSAPVRSLGGMRAAQVCSRMRRSLPKWLTRCFTSTTGQKGDPICAGPSVDDRLIFLRRLPSATCVFRRCRLVCDALSAGSDDNISVVVMYFKAALDL